MTASENVSCPAQVTKTPTVLAVDDEPEFLEFIVEALEENGISVICADSVEKAVRYLHARSDISLVITDLAMPERDGCQLLEYKQQNLRFADIPCLVCSGHSSHDWLGEVLGLGAVDYIVKPVSIETLLTRVRRAIERTTVSLLLVEPDRPVAALMERTFSHPRFHVFSARTGKAALDLFRQQQTSAVIAAHTLPDMSGLSLLDKIKEVDPGVPVLILVRKDANISRQQLIASGADEVISLPLCNLETVNQVLTLVRARQPRQKVPAPVRR